MPGRVLPEEEGINEGKKKMIELKPYIISNIKLSTSIKNKEAKMKQAFKKGSFFAVNSFLVLCLALTFSSCAQSKQARKVEASGFLKDYSMLKKGEGDEALLRYINPEADFSKYRKIILEPVTVWRGSKSGLAKMDVEDVQKLVDYLHSKVNEELEKDFTLVDRPGGDTMRIRIALTDADKSMVVLDTISNVIPIGLGVSILKDIATGKPSSVGDASIEAEVLDSLSNDRLGAFVDRRVGGKALRGKFDSWDDVKEAYDYWAKGMGEKLAELRKR